MHISELQLNDSTAAEQLTVKSDVRTATDISIVSPIPIKAIFEETEISVTNNFTMHFNRCTKLSPGGKFNISFAGT